MPNQAAIRPPNEMTVEQFLAWDGGGHVGKLELVDGVARAMAPASAVHAIIQGNIVTAFNIHLRANKSPCRAGTEAPIVPPARKRINARAPDVSVTCRPPADDGTFVDPVLIVEVLSPGNESDTWESIRTLTGLASLIEVLVVQSTRIEVHLYRRDQTGAWRDEPDSTALDGSGRLDLRSIGLQLTAADIYQGTQFDPAEI